VIIIQMRQLNKSLLTNDSFPHTFIAWLLTSSHLISLLFKELEH
jgi:hypothetical protein